VGGWGSRNIWAAGEEQGTSQANPKISEGGKGGWESIVPLKKKNNKKKTTTKQTKNPEHPLISN